MAAFNEERITNSLEELELHTKEDTPTAPDDVGMPTQPEARRVVYEGLISLCVEATTGLSHGLKEIRLACLDWRDDTHT